jgi:pyruvate kinase
LQTEEAVSEPTIDVSPHPRPVPNAAPIKACRDLLNSSIATIDRESEAIFADWEAEIARPEFRTGARNLAFYLAARQHDLTDLQTSLSTLGLSSLGRAESHLRQSLAAVSATLDRLSGLPATWPDPSAINAGLEKITRDQALFFGDYPGARQHPHHGDHAQQGATDPRLVGQADQAGASCFRINCAHDGSRNLGGDDQQHSRRRQQRKAGTARCSWTSPDPKCRIETVDMPDMASVCFAATVSADGRAGPASTTSAVNHHHISRTSSPGCSPVFWSGSTTARSAPGSSKSLMTAPCWRSRCRATRARSSKLEKGINFPAIDLEIEHLTHS